MGCDIHFFTETKQPDGSWKLLGTFAKEEDDSDWFTQQDRSLYSGRNYNLFAILADVRNGRGFAGVKTGEGFNPISAPRGVPADASAEYKAIVDQWDCDGHSHSHHTLRQLLDYDWTQTTQLQGWVPLAAWEKWSRWQRDEGQGPDSYCGGVSGPDVTHLSAEQMDELSSQLRTCGRGEPHDQFLQKHGRSFGLAVWETPYYREAPQFMNEVIPQLLKLAGGTSGLDDVRIVFFFDN